MADVKTEQEPSIEEILESIRQIISEDGETDTQAAAPAEPPAAEAPAPKPAAAAPAPEPEPEPAPAPLDLTEKVEEEAAAPAEEPPAPQEEPAIDMQDAPMTEEPQEEPIDIALEDAPAADAAPAATPAAGEEGDLISSQAASAAAASLSKMLMGNVAVEREDVGRPGKITLEDMTRELMKPMLKTWLDQNLPGIIEKTVQKEIEKIARRVMDK